MVNKIILCLLVVILGLQAWLFVKVYSSNEQIAYIDTSKLFQSSKQMQALKKQMEGEKEKVKANVDTLMSEFQNSLKEYEKSASKMSAKEKQLSQELLRNKQNGLMQYQQAVEQKSLEEEQRKTQEVLSTINAYISEYGKEKNYKIILATSSGNIAYGDKGIDITEEIINGVNAK